MADATPACCASGCVCESTHSTGTCETPIAGHIAYALGSASDNRHGGFRKGLDAALVFPMHDLGDRKGIGVSGLRGFGSTPSFVEPELSYLPNDADCAFCSAFLGGGPVLRFPKDGYGSGYGFGLRLAQDFFFLNFGLRTLFTHGDGRSDASLLFSFGLGRL